MEQNPALAPEQRRRFEAVAHTPRHGGWHAMMLRKLEGQHLMRLMGMQLSWLQPGYAEAALPLSQGVLQQDGIVHGGTIATAADIVTGFAAFSLAGPHDRVVTSDLKVSFFTPGRGKMLAARGWVTKPGSRLHYCEAEIFAGDEADWTLIAKAFAIMAVIQDKDKPANNP